MTYEILLAGFGGQGILFAGKLLAYCALFEGKEISWLPSYGPEMRGGKCNCSVCISDEPIGSPQVLEPDLLVVLNGPSFDAFVPNVKPGGKAFIDSSMVDAKTTRTDIDCFYVPATQLADDNNLAKGANIVLLGKLLHETGIFSFETVRKALEKNTPAKRAHTIDNNMAALKLGADYQG
ncbi:MAG: 2-oxoacid:acceptor oxidoreductase family protein [Oscillospiraceae bacterium]|nr:2-oxoacid:acceptor oxidoreductase family protein [Oscillospiraceae bacterium]